LVALRLPRFLRALDRNQDLHAGVIRPYKAHMISGQQCRMARGALGISAPELSRRTRIATATILRFERGDVATNASIIVALQAAFEAAGIEFIDEDNGGPGVRVRKAGGSGNANGSDN
jgi:hypothetical protein